MLAVHAAMAAFGTSPRAEGAGSTIATHDSSRFMARWVGVDRPYSVPATMTPGDS